MLMTHYRQPLDFTVRGLEVAEKVLTGWYRLVGDATAPEISDWKIEIETALWDDLNTPAAIARLHSMSDVVGEGEDPTARGRFKLAANMLGLLTSTEGQWRAEGEARAGIDQTRVKELVASRLSARSAKDFKEADRIRDELAAMGVALKDAKDPATGEIVTTWELAR
jgi:cysteinyl-tRNA synthetase